jgi:hypothetical protein
MNDDQCANDLIVSLVERIGAIDERARFTAEIHPARAIRRGLRARLSSENGNANQQGRQQKKYAHSGRENIA